MNRRFDLTGFALLAITLTSIQLLLDRGNHIDWFSSVETWIYAFLGLSGAAYLLAKQRKVLGRITAIVLAASALWLPVSIALARNASLNFAGWNGTLWFLFTIGLFFAAIGTLMVAVAVNLYSLRKAKSAAK